MISLGAWWHLAAKAPILDVADLTDGGGLVVLAPHPDDESLGCGGLLAAAAQNGIPCLVVLLSDGSNSHPRSRAWSPLHRARRREQEMIEALTALGLAETCLSSLGFVDGQVPAEGKLAMAAVDWIASLCEQIDASALLATWSEDPHADHQATAAIARDVCRIMNTNLVHYAYPIWSRTRPATDLIDTDHLTAFRLPVGQHLSMKEMAIACHRSQHGLVFDDDPYGFMLQPEFIDLFLQPYELYFRIEQDDTIRSA